MSFGQPPPFGQAGGQNANSGFRAPAAPSVGFGTPSGASSSTVRAASVTAGTSLFGTSTAKLFQHDQGKSTGLGASSKFAQLFADETLTVYFPCNKRQYTLHKSLLSSKSIYFKSLLSSTMREATAGRLVLDWTASCEIAFRSIIQYLYTGDYNVNDYGSVHTLDGVKSFPSGFFASTTGDIRLSADPDHAHIYVVADRLMMPELKSLALARFMAPNSEDRVMHIYSEFIKPLVDILYYDGVDMPREQEKIKAEEGNLEGKAAHPPSAGAPSEVSSSNDAGATPRAASGSSDPRQSMQKEFVKKMLMGIKLDQISAVCGELMLEGGQFAQDVFLAMSKSEADSSLKRPFG